MEPYEQIPDPVEQFLHTPVAGTAPLRLQQQLLSQTLRSLRWKRRRRSAVWIGLVAAGFLAGAMCTHLLNAPAPDEKQQQTKRPVVPVEKPDDVRRPLENKVGPSPATNAVALEWTAFDEPERHGDLYRKAGDLYVQENQDYEAALRCYTQALDANSEENLTIAPDDNWLIMALKEARKKEKAHAKKNG